MEWYKILMEIILGLGGLAGSGELYNSNAFLSLFKEFLTELDEIFSDVRFVGNNKEYSRNISTKIENLQKKIEETALIASS